jgi:protein subunit release factor A
MDLIKIINLMKETEMPESFEEFKKEYLDDNSMFTDDGAREYLDNITGYISYLNREKDARQFAYPVFYKVFSKLSRKDASNEEELKKNLENIQVDIKDLDGQIKQADKATKPKLKLDLKELKEKEKEAKKELKQSLKTSKEDNSQETALELCFKKK